MMLKLLTILLLSLTCHQFLIQQSQPNPIPQAATNYTGNFSTDMLNTINNVIHASTARYAIKQYDDMAQFIGDALDKAYGQSWQVYVSHSEECVMKSSTNYHGHVLAWKDTGLYHLCYIIFKTSLCKVKMTKTQHQQMINSAEYWGSSFNETGKQKIRTMVKDATIYQADNAYNNAVYINGKLGTGNWTTTIMTTASDSNYGYYYCVVNDYWVDLVAYEHFNWTYSISRYN